MLDAAHPPAEAVCVECSYTFRFNAEFYRANGLQPPKRCKRCRDARRVGSTPPRPRLSGVVRTIDYQGGFGFIAPDGGGRDLYFAPHDTGPASWPPRVGDRVTFEIEETPRRRARCVRL